MKTLTKYQANDGSEWDTAEEAQKRDELHAKVEAAMAPLGDVPEAVEKGKGWLQHDMETVNVAKDRILDICREEGFNKHFPAFNNPGRDCHPLSIIGRVLNDNGGPLDRAWSRFARIDEQGREHQQCYFAYTGGPESHHICIEDRS